MYPVKPRSKVIVTVWETYPHTPELDKLGLSGKPHSIKGQAVDIAPLRAYEKDVFYVIAPVYGIILEAGKAPQRGNYIIMQEAGTEATHHFYHLAWRYSRPGTKVVKGTPIGVMGNTGRSTAKHLHYEVRDGLPIRRYLT